MVLRKFADAVAAIRLWAPEPFLVIDTVLEAIASRVNCVWEGVEGWNAEISEDAKNAAENIILHLNGFGADVGEKQRFLTKAYKMAYAVRSGLRRDGETREATVTCDIHGPHYPPTPWEDICCKED